MQRLQNQTLPHALLVAAPSGLGKREFVDAFVRTLLCESHDFSQGCGHCRACLLNAAGSHPDRVTIALELRDDGKPRTEITVDQIRGLSQRLALTSQFGGYQCAVIDPADAMNVNASNALLKTLEEPTPASIIVLVSDQPARLPATIRSRCQRLAWSAPAPDVVQNWLLGQGIEPKLAEKARIASDGNPGLALRLIQQGSLVLREELSNDLGGLHTGREAALDVALRWSKSEPETRLWLACGLVREQSRADVSATPGPLNLTRPIDSTKLAGWFDQANRTRESLRGPLRPELALLELLSSWCALAPAGRA